ncbi:MAG TPA: LCP family protein [Nocardioides sp.]
MPDTPPSSAGRRVAPKRRAKSKRRHTVATVIASTGVILMMVTALSAAFFVRQLDANISTFANADEALGDDRPEKADVDTPEEPMNILLVGSDRNNPDNGARSDTTIIMHLSGDREFAYGVSLPRDALVDRPECVTADGEDVPAADMVMFNTAYSEAGALCTQRTVESLTDIRIDVTIEMDFGGFEDMVDAIDGVEICLTEPIRESRYNKALPKEGTFTATGEEALIYVRERHQLSINGDVGRMKRQQAFLASMANKVISAETLTNPTRVYSFVNAVYDSMTVTEGYRTKQLADIALSFNGVGLDNINFLTVPNEEYAENRNRLVWTDEADDLWELIRNDEPLTAEFLTGSIGSTEGGGSVNTGDATASPTDTPSSTATDDTTTDPTDDATDADPTDDEEFNAEDFAASNGLC